MPWRRLFVPRHAPDPAHTLGAQRADQVIGRLERIEDDLRTVADDLRNVATRLEGVDGGRDERPA